jgi:hypothetical protein
VGDAAVRRASIAAVVKHPLAVEALDSYGLPGR